MMQRPLSFGKWALPNCYLCSQFRLLLIRIQVAVGARPPIAYQLEQLFLEYETELLKAQIRGRFKLKPARRIVL